MVFELEAGLRSLFIGFMCWIKFYVFVYLVHTGGNSMETENAIKLLDAKMHNKYRILATKSKTNPKFK